MQTQLKSWGNSQGIRLSKELLSIVGFLPDDVLQIEAADGRIIISKQFVHKTLAERAEKFNGQLNLNEEVTWGDPVGNEVW